MRKENCYEQLKLFLLIFFIVILSGWKAEATIPAPLPTVGWTDSLKVSVVDSFVEQVSSESYLHFTIVVERKNADWNNQDTILGNSDLYFFANLAAFVGDPEFVEVHDSLFVGPRGAVTGSPLARLQISARQWAGRLQIALTRRDEGNRLLKTDSIAVAGCPYLLRLTLNKPDTLCKIKWKLKGPTLAVNTGIMWDAGNRGATGLQSLGGNPILEDLSGGIPTLPMPILNVDTLRESLYVCEGSALEVAVHAEASGDARLQFEWYDSIPGKSAHFLDPDQTLQRYTESGKEYSYSYRFSAAGDTLYIDQVPGCLDSIYFACKVSVPSLGVPSVYTITRLYVRDSIWGFISGASDVLTPDMVDTVTFCEGEEGVAVRFNIFGPSLSELSEVDSIWFEYRTEAADGYLEQDTIAFKVPDNLNSRPNPNNIDGYSVFWFPATLNATGKIFINRMWTTYCENAAPATKYDTIYIEQGTYQVLDRLVVMAGETIIMDSVNSPWFSSNLPESIVSLKGLGTVPNGVIALPFRYQAKDTVGLDTVVYKMNNSDKCSWMIREVEVQDWKYVKVKVFLEGPYVNNDSMKCLLTYANVRRWGSLASPYKHLRLPKSGAGSHYISPYDSLEIIDVNQFHAFLQREEAKGHSYVDWIYVQLKEVKGDGKAGNTIVSKTALLRSDGAICDTAGNFCLNFKNLNNDKYFIVVQHRNHLAMMSDRAYTLNSDSRRAELWNPFEDGTIDGFGRSSGSGPAKKIHNKWCMWGGNANRDREVPNAYQRITVGDENITIMALTASDAAVSGYHVEDYNFDGRVTTVDRNIVHINVTEFQAVSHVK